MNLIRTQIQLTEEQAEALKKISSEKKLSISELIRRGVDLLLKNFFTIDIEVKKKRALNISGMFHTGKNDLSLNHDRYLDENFNK